MSGLCGIVNLDGAPVSAATLALMAGAAGHRAPDGLTYWTGPKAGLAQLARHFTPESEHECQPLTGMSGRVVLVADARIDNRDDLIAALGKDGAPAGRAATDLHLVLAAYERWGHDCARHLLGDFSFAVWDARDMRLFAARDVMGARGFYYRVEPARVLFGTEVKQILADPAVPARIFEPALGLWLLADSGPLDWTFYEGIAQLPPGHALLADASGVRVWKYWDIDPGHRIVYRDDNEYAQHLLDLFEKAVWCRLRSSRPVGIWLSGGLDSGSVASMAGRLRELHANNGYPPLRAYCYAYESLKEADERHISDLIASRYGMPVTPVPVERAWPLKDHLAHAPDRDDPCVGPYQPAVELGLGMARADGMGGMLSGTHGDHMMGGSVYEYTDMFLSGRWLALWRDLLAHSRRTGDSTMSNAWHKVLRPIAAEVTPLASAVRKVKRPIRRVLRRPGTLPQWVRPDFARRIGLDELRCLGTLQPKGRGYGRRQRYRKIFGPVERNNVTVLERTCARFGLERLDPWGDRRIAEFVLAVPPAVLCRAGEQKRLARLAMRGLMPEKARCSAGKIYPTALYELGTRLKERSTVLGLLTNSRLAALGYVDAALLRRHFETSTTEEEADGFWPALAAEMWLRRYWT